MNDATTKMDYLPLFEALRLASCWRAAGGRPEVEVAELEPTLWREGYKDVADLARELAACGMAVSMIINGSRPAHLSPGQAQVGLSRLRLSWHTLDAKRFPALTATGDYATFMNGVHAAIAVGLPLSINRVLSGDLSEHVACADKYPLRLKLLDLYDTTDNGRERVSVQMPIRPNSATYWYPRCGWSKTVASRRTALRVGEQIETCPRCGDTPLK